MALTAGKCMLESRSGVANAFAPVSAAHLCSAFPYLRAGRKACAYMMLGVLCGCSSLLPRGEVEITTHFASFEEARDSIKSLKPFSSTKQTLAEMGLDPGKQANTTILTFSDMLHRFVAGSAIERKDLHPGIVACFDAVERCTGWEIAISKISKRRTGNVVLDLINYSRRTEVTGWRFNAIVLLVDDTVVYRTWGGQPEVNELETTRNPLGPLQNIDLPSLWR
jgi:hypothetical protein